MENDNTEHNEEELTLEDVAYSSHYKTDALISLLIKKGIISEEEYDKEINELYEELEKNHQH